MKARLPQGMGKGPGSQKDMLRQVQKMQQDMEALQQELEEREYDLNYINIIYVGGGAVAVKNFTENKDNVAYDCDILANAKGYEFLADQMLRKQRAA